MNTNEIIALNDQHIINTYGARKIAFVRGEITHHIASLVPGHLLDQGHLGVQVWINQGTYSEDENDGADAKTGQAPKKPKRAYKR